jgi:hypothetical protein
MNGLVIYYLIFVCFHHFEKETIGKKIGVNIYLDYFIYGPLSNLLNSKGYCERKKNTVI